MRAFRNVSFIVLLSLSILITAGICFGQYVYSSGEYDYKNIYITEICPKNDVNAYDDNGEYGADYIELYNAADHDIRLNGYFLSDDENNLHKADLKKAKIRANETLVVWCSPNTDDERSYADGYIPRDIHQKKFSIADGESIILSKGNTVLEKISLPPQFAEDKVYSSSKSGLKTFEIADPSIYVVPEKNIIKKEEKKIPAPVFSAGSGWYDEPFYLELSCSEGDIYYTTDGSEPDSSSIRYEDGIYVYDRSSEANIYANIRDISLTNPYLPDHCVDKAMLVKAVSIKDGVYSDVVSQVYFVGPVDGNAYRGLPVMEITMDPEDLFGYHDGIYVTGNVYDTYKAKFDPVLLERRNKDYFFSYANYAKEGKGWERRARIEYFDEAHKFVFGQDIGIRIHGGWSTSFNQKGFNLYAREEYDGQRSFAYDFFGKKYNKIMLRTGGYRDVYATKIRDVLNQKLVSGRDIGIQNASPCIVFINGEFWGLYNLQETIGTGYVSENYDVDPDNVLIMKGSNEANIEGYENAYKDIAEFAAGHDLREPENYEYMEDRIDIQSYIDYISFEIYVANCDSIDNNFARWRCVNKENEGFGDCRWRYLLYDTDDSAGMVPGLTDHSTDSFVSGHWSSDLLGDKGDPVFSALIRNPEFKKRFVISFMDMANDNFSYAKVSEILDEMADKYQNGVTASQKRFRGSYILPDYSEIDTYKGSYDEKVFESDISVIREFYRNRFDSIVKYLKDDLELEGELHKVTIGISGPENTKISLNTIKDIKSGWTGYYYPDYPLTIRCEVPGGYSFAGWKDEEGRILSKETEYIFTPDRDVSITAVLDEN